MPSPKASEQCRESLLCQRRTEQTLAIICGDACPCATAVLHTLQSRCNLAVLILQVLHPAEALLQSVQLQTPSPPRHAMRGLPEVVRMKAAPLIIGPKGSRRLELELRVAVPGAFGAMNISGPVSDWSYPPEAFKVGPGLCVEHWSTGHNLTNLCWAHEGSLQGWGWSSGNISLPR